MIALVFPSNATVASSPKLLDRLRWILRAKHYSIRTEQAYVDWTRRFILFHNKRHPDEMGEKEISVFSAISQSRRTSPLQRRIRRSAHCCFFISKCSIGNSISSTTSSASPVRQNYQWFSLQLKRARFCGN